MRRGLERLMGLKSYMRSLKAMKLAFGDAFGLLGSGMRRPMSSW